MATCGYATPTIYHRLAGIKRFWWSPTLVLELEAVRCLRTVTSVWTVDCLCLRENVLTFAGKGLFIILTSIGSFLVGPSGLRRIGGHEL